MKKDSQMLPRTILVIDTCGAVGSVALARDEEILGERSLPDRTASAKLLEAVRELLPQGGHVDGIGVVSGPGSFTGVRVGLSAAKAFCEAWSVPLAAVSRLEVLGEGATVGLAVMDAGRGEAYVRDLSSEREWIEMLPELDALIGTGLPAVCDDARLAQKLPSATVRSLTARNALPAVLRCFARGGTEVSLSDANYVRGESEIYAKRSTPRVGE